MSLRIASTVVPHHATEKAIEYILNRRDASGLWRDFSSLHGESVDWISAYVGLSLLRAGIHPQHLEKTAQSLIERADSGWGYNNDTFSSDADSTAFVIRFLSVFGYDMNHAKEFLLQHRNEDGGFGTYTPESVIHGLGSRLPQNMSVRGWCASSPDITASVLLALGRDEHAIEYLRKTQTINGHWRSYWYTDDIYSTTQSIHALKTGSEVERARAWLATQNPTTPFYVALSMQGLEPDTTRIATLAQMQSDDGSWQNHPVLRVPLPSNLEPWKNDQMLRKNLTDQNLLFTTATCLSALVYSRE